MKLLGSILALALFVAGCSSASQSSTAPDHAWKADYSKWGMDPVAGHLMLKSKAAAQKEYEGTLYYFADEQEARAFESNPSAYLGQNSPEKSPSSGDAPHLSNAHSR